MPQPEDLVFWSDAGGAQLGPEPFETVRQRVHAGQIPATTPVWWDGAPDWIPFDQVDSGAGAPGGPAPAVAAATGPATASAALMSGLSDQELDDEVVALVNRSWKLYKETEFATSIDEAMLGGVITALVDCGFVLIDLETPGAGLAAAPAQSGITVETGAASPVPVRNNSLRFEEPETHARVVVELEHLTPDVATSKLIGHRAAVVVGYGERVPNFSQVGQAVRQEVQSGWIASPEPGTVTFDADISSGYVYAQIDLLLELDRYVGEDLSVDHDLLRRHLASVVYTMQTFIRARFGS